MKARLECGATASSIVIENAIMEGAILKGFGCGLTLSNTIKNLINRAREKC